MLALTPNSFDRAAPPVAWVDGLDSDWLLERQTAGLTVVVVRQKDGQIGSGWKMVWGRDRTEVLTVCFRVPLQSKAADL